MRKVTELSAACLVAGLLCAGTSFAKGSTQALVIVGPGLNAPVSTNEGSTVSAANVWGGSFVDWDRGEAIAPPAGTRTYEIYFFVQPARAAEAKLMYVVHYAVDPASGNALIHMPGRGERWYELNTSTIMRPQDGKWVFADAAWSKSIEKLLASQQ